MSGSRWAAFWKEFTSRRLPPIRAKWAAALPTILVSLTLLFSIWGIFGVRYVVMTSFLTLVFQRFYYFTDHFVTPGQVPDAADADWLLRLAELFRRAERELNGSENSALRAQLEQLRNEPGLKDERQKEAMGEILRVFGVALQALEQVHPTRPQKDWALPGDQNKGKAVRYAFGLDQFTNRFAVRLSAVLCLGFGFVWLTGLEHAYWYPMTAFLMLMPYAEESRMKIGNRIRSTLGGAVVSVLLMSLFHTMPEYILIMAVMTCFMYYAPVTSWTMTVYSTCYGMTLAQMRLGLMESVTLRLAYVALANRFLLPMNRQLVSEIEQINAYLRSRPHLLNTGYSRMTAEVLDNLEDAILRIKLSYTKNELVPFFDTGRSPQAFGRLEDSLYFNTLAVNCLQTLRQMNDLMESKANP